MVWIARTATALMVAWIIVLPIPLGGVQPGGWLLATAGGLLLASLTLASTSSLAHLRPAAVAVALAGALALLGALQAASLPEAAVRSLSPRSVELYHDAAASLRAAGVDELPHLTISLAPRRSIETALLAAAAAGALIAAALLSTSRTRRRVLIGGVFAAAALQIVLALVEGTDRGRISGAFVNPNHLGGYLEIALALSFGLLWMSVAGSRRQSAPSHDVATRFERNLLPILWRVLLWGTVAGAIALTRSRGAVIAALLSTVVMGSVALISSRRTLSRLRAVVGVACTLALGIALVFAATRGAAIERFLESDPREVTADARLRAWETSIEAWKEFPVLGAGLGAFREAFRPHQPEGLRGLWEWAHSDPLQILVTGGAVGFILAAGVWIALMIALARGWRSQQHREESAIALAGMLALVSLAVHGFVDFNLSIPAILMTLAVTSGIAIGAAWAPPRRSRSL